VCKAHHPCAVNDHHKRHTPQFEQVDFLLESPCHPVIRIGQADERQALRPPVQAESSGSIGTDCNHLGSAADEFRIVILQTRQLRAAIRSEEAAQERQHHGPAAKVGESNQPSVCVTKFEIGGGLAKAASGLQARPILGRWPRCHRTWQAEAFQSACSAGSDGSCTAAIAWPRPDPQRRGNWHRGQT